MKIEPYQLRNLEEIQQFLACYPFLSPLLEEASEQIKKHFPQMDMALEIVTDPETLDFTQAVVYILVDQEPDRASEMLDQFDDAWWLEALDRAKGKLCITLGFI